MGQMGNMVFSEKKRPTFLFALFLLAGLLLFPHPGVTESIGEKKGELKLAVKILGPRKFSNGARASRYVSYVVEKARKEKKKAEAKEKASAT